MRMVSVEEFASNSTELLKWVNEHNDEIEVLDKGATMARIVPPKKLTPEEAEALNKWWEETDALAQKIGAVWPAGVSAAEAVKEQRREL